VLVLGSLWGSWPASSSLGFERSSAGANPGSAPVAAGSTRTIGQIDDAQVGIVATTPTPVPVAPGTPVQVSPGNGVAITQQNPTATMVWRTVSGANEYQVVLDDGKISSPWVTGTTWTTAVLTAGQHVWQVRARNYGGNSALSVKWLLFVNTSGTPSSPSAAPSVAPSQAPGDPTAGLTALPVSGPASVVITLRGGGFSGSEPVRITLDSASGPLLGTIDAATNGSISTSVTIGDASRGTHSIVARGQSSGRQQPTTYTVTPSLSRSPVTGPPGTAVTVTAHGFAASETVRLTWLTATGPVLADLSTGLTGTGSASFSLPDAARGSHDYSGLGLTSGARAWGNFGIEPALLLSTASALPGQQVVATARGFSSGTPVTFTWNRSAASAGSTLCTVTSDSSGRSNCPITVPGGTGVFPVTATAADGTSQTRSLQVNGGLSATLSPTSGVVGSTVQVSAGGFATAERLALRWDAGSVVTTVTASGSGTVSQLITVPFLPYGGHTLTLQGQTSGRQASAGFTVGQSGSLSPSGGASGSRVDVSGQGLPAGQPATVYWNRTAGMAGVALCSGTVTATGTFACSITVPAATANTTYPVVIVAGTVTVQLSFRVSGSGSGGGPVGPPTSGNGTYVVNATREGLVGGTTSSGHVIQTLDRFVSLPACTASSCPWLTPGVAHSMWGIRTECGSTCYVRIVNPANNRCVVAPIEDTGPWYTQDDYWNPTASRFLNTLPANPNVLRQGYTGAQAARDGLDTGYGIAPSGIGISNKGYEVGSSSAIDIGDGSWVDLGYNISGASAGAVTVTMLWQSGENPAAAAQACGQSSANPAAGSGTATPQPSVTPRTPMATPRTPTATPRTPTATPRTPTATPPTPTTTPRTPTATPRTPTATPPTAPARITVAPSSAPAGSVVRVSGSGFAPGETVMIRSGSSTGIAIGRVVAQATGGFAVDVATSALAGGNRELVARGETSARLASATVSIRASVAVDPRSGAPGTNVLVRVAGFQPSERVAVRWGSPTATTAGTIQTNAIGQGSASVRVPAGSGSLTLYATGLTVAQTVSTGFDRLPDEAVQAAAVPNESTPAMGATPVMTATPVYGATPGTALAPTVTPGSGEPRATRGRPTRPPVTSPTSVAPTPDLATPAVATVTPTGAASPIDRSRTRGTPSTAGRSTPRTLKPIAPTTVPTMVSTEPATATVSATLATTLPPVTAVTSEPTRPATLPETGQPSMESTIEPTGSATSETGPTVPAEEPGSARPPDADPSIAVEISASQEPTTEPTVVTKATDDAGRTPRPSRSSSVTSEAVEESTAAPTQEPTASPTKEPTATPNEEPTATPTVEPTATVEVTSTPTQEPIPTVEPTATAIPEPTLTPEPTATAIPEPTSQTQTIYPIADTSVAAIDPDMAQAPEDVTGLSFGGPDGAVSYLTFDVSSVAAPGSIVSASLSLTGTGASGGAGGELLAIPGVIVDEYGVTWNTRPTGAGNAIDSAGVPVWVDLVSPGGVTSVDVSGTVSAGGIVTFVLTGQPDVETTIGSRESWAPPTLTVETVVYPGI
jgi:hypothetical protein